jgi:uncharacterized membrane protein YdjX (TVP38/TMEM64 family)
LPTSSRLKSIAPWASVLLLVVVALVAGKAVDRHIAEIEAWIADLGNWGVVVFIAFFVATTSALFPESILAIMAGALFGFRSGLAIVLAGNLIAAPLQYALSRWVLHTRIARVLAGRPRLAEVQAAGRRNELGVQLLLRLAPLNPATVSYVLGAAGTRFPGFLLACVGLVPHLAAEVYLGYAGKHLVHVAGRETLSLRDLTWIGGFIAAIAVIPFLSRLVRRALGTSAPGVGRDGAAK